jgi:hypothetical protein
LNAHDDGNDHNGERERELLRRILQFDIEEAVARYEAETGLCVSHVDLTSTGPADFAFDLEAQPGPPHKHPPLPVTRLLLLNLNR